MAVVTGSSVLRRTPAQARSRERVERILDAASRIVAEAGVEALTTRSVAAASGVPVASLYQYFSDRDAILLALVERDTAEMDEQVRADLGALEVLSVTTLVETTMRAYVKVYTRRPDFVEIWLRGRTNAAVHEFGRQHNRRTATELRELAVAAGLATEQLLPAAAELAVEIGDRVFQLAYERDPRGDAFVIEEGIAMVTAYLRGYATPAGLEGVRR
ncbi:MAG: TetR/AcrR family transcriptional regulator [Nocardioidaceae bacterium]|nr:TetR/AcrR family transcriptional regulator [Nocardioidaceae bacterium]